MKQFLAGLGAMGGIALLASSVPQDPQDEIARSLERIAAAEERQAAALERVFADDYVKVLGDVRIRLDEETGSPGHYANVKAGIVAIASAVDQYAIENNGKYPDSLMDLVTPDEEGFSYLPMTTAPMDPWGNEYVYEPPGPGTHEYRIVSYGSDGVPGGEGDAKDIDNIMIRNGDV